MKLPVFPAFFLFLTFSGNSFCFRCAFMAHTNKEVGEMAQWLSSGLKYLCES